MNIDEISKIKNEEDRVKAAYDFFDESSRLTTKAGRVEFLTTVKQIEKYLKPGMRILDIGAGTGEYSFYFAEKGYDVTSVELVSKHVNHINLKCSEEMSLKAYQGNALDLSILDDDFYDIVLNFGPLYHLSDIKDRIRSINEAKRVCKDDGRMFFAFISNDMVIATETMCYNMDFIKDGTYDHESFKLDGKIFTFHTVNECRELLSKCRLDILCEVAADGLSELLSDKINNLDDEAYKLWLNYHYYCCEKPEFLGTSNHLLFVAEKTGGE